MAGKAEARLIYASISTSVRVAHLGIKGALLFTWLLAHCDSQGRFAGIEKVIKAQVVPFLKFRLKDIEESLELMECNYLIQRYYDSKGRSLIQILDWWQWQSGLKYRAPSRYEPPPNWHDVITPRDSLGRFRVE